MKPAMSAPDAKGDETCSAVGECKLHHRLKQIVPMKMQVP